MGMLTLAACGGRDRAETADAGAADAAQNEQLKALIEKAKPVIQKHLDQAEEIEGNLGKATT
jgi:predicted outer membrane protein